MDEEHKDLQKNIEFATPSPVRAAKWLVFTLLVIASVYAFTETAAVLTYRLSFGEPFSFSHLTTERAAIENEETVFEDTSRTGRGEVIHPYVGYVRNPEVAKGSVNVYGLMEHINPIQSRKSGQLIVAITGGSVARQFFGQGVPTLEQLLRTSPRLAAVRFVFIPLAIPGYKQPQQLMLVAYLLTLGAQFDWIINLDGFNEVALHHAENGRKGVFPAYPRSWYFRVKGLPDPACRFSRP
jgi:hypothetical protein